MSDYWGDILPNQLPRKRIYEQERLLLESRRKSSVISNISNDDAGIFDVYSENKMKNDGLDNGDKGLKKQKT